MGRHHPDRLDHPDAQPVWWPCRRAVSPLRWWTSYLLLWVGAGVAELWITRSRLRGAVRAAMMLVLIGAAAGGGMLLGALWDA